MAALTAPRNTLQRFGSPAFLVKAATVVYQGSLVVIDTGLIAAGRAEHSAAAGERVAVLPGTFKFANLAADAIAQADVGTDCYIVDDQTVAKTNGGNTRSRAGKVIDIDADGVWVSIGLGQ